jgi:hypothetical protein
LSRSFDLQIGLRRSRGWAEDGVANDIYGGFP